MSTWSKFGAHGEHGDVFLFSNLGALWFLENLIRYSLHICLREVKNNFFFLQKLLFTAFLVTVLKISTYALVSTWSLVNSGWEHVERKMHPCIYGLDNVMLCCGKSEFQEIKICKRKKTIKSASISGSGGWRKVTQKCREIVIRSREAGSQETECRGRCQVLNAWYEDSTNVFKWGDSLWIDFSKDWVRVSWHFCPYLIFVIFFTWAKFLENKIYTEKRQFFALNL